MINYGGINLTDSIINSEFRIGVLEKIVDDLIKTNYASDFSQQSIEDAKEKTLSEMQKKYPDAGLSIKG